MMSVLEYANDVSKSVDEILKLCERMRFSKESEEDLLSDEEITILDGEIASISTEEEDEEENSYNDDEFFERVETLAEESYRNEKPKTKWKGSKKGNASGKDSFLKDKKEMYKHRERLMSNDSAVEEDVVLDKGGMTVQAVAGP